MSTLRVSNIEAKADPSSPTVNEKVKITNSNGDVMLQLDGATSGITTVGINTTTAAFTVDGAQNFNFVGVVTAASLSGNLTGNVTGTVNTSGVSTFSGGINVTGGRVGLGTDNPGRLLHLNANGAAEQIWEQGDGKADRKKFNLVVDSGNASTESNIYLRYLNDDYSGGNYIWSYSGETNTHSLLSNGNTIATVNPSGVNVTGIITASTAVNAPGSIVQVIHTNLGSSAFTATSTSGTYRATGFGNTITPKFSTSRILHIVTIGCQFICDGQIVIYRNGSQSSGSLQDSYRDGITGSYTNDMPAHTFTYLDTTPSASANNYELYCRATGCTGVMFVGSSGDFDSTWTLMEVAN